MFTCVEAKKRHTLVIGELKKALPYRRVTANSESGLKLMGMAFSFGDLTQAAMGTVVAGGRRWVVAWLSDHVVQITAVPTGCTAVWHFGHDVPFVISPDEKYCPLCFSLILDSHVRSTKTSR